MVERGELLRFDQFLLDKQARALHRVLPDGGTMSIHIGSRAFQILCLLVDGAGQIIASRQIMDAVWPDIAVEQNNLAVQIFALRRVLDLDREQGTCIQNIPGRGYRFVPSVTQVTPAGATVDNALPANVPSGSDGTDDDAERAAPTDQPDPMPVSSLPPLGSARPGRVVRIALPGLAVAALVVVSIWHLGRTPAANAPAIPATIAAADRPRLSLVVLPFRNVDREDLSEDTVDAITDDLTSDLARVYDLFVIGRGSAFSYKGKPIDIKRVGDELGVRYAVEGSVRKVDGTLRVGVQLLSTETGAHVWADHFDLKRDGISYTVDDIVRPISHILNARIVDSESLRAMRERPANPDVIDLVLAGTCTEQSASHTRKATSTREAVGACCRTR